MFKLRFNLSRGKNFRKWKVTYPNNLIFYYPPNNTRFKLTNCLLKNSKKVSEQIFNGSNKKVCSWIECEKLEILANKIDITNLNEIKFNPRINPYWDLNNENVDMNKFEVLYTNENKIYI